LRIQDEEEKPLANGNTPAYACGPLTKERYINPKIEQELVDFKQEIEEKYHDSEINRTYSFPRVDDRNQMTIDDQNSLMRQLNRINDDTNFSE
jgi:hypothetical protein